MEKTELREGFFSSSIVQLRCMSPCHMLFKILGLNNFYKIKISHNSQLFVNKLRIVKLNWIFVAQFTTVKLFTTYNVDMWINCKLSRHFCTFQKHIDVVIVSANVGLTVFPLCWRLLLAYTNLVVTRQLDQCSSQPSTSPARLLLTPWWRASLVWWRAEGWGLPPIYHIFENWS